MSNNSDLMYALCLTNINKGSDRQIFNIFHEIEICETSRTKNKKKKN